MTIEEKLKELIKNRYPSVRQFIMQHKEEDGSPYIPYTTLDSIFRRGIENSSVSNVRKICEVLNISVQGVLNDEIIPCSTEANRRESVVQIVETLLAHRFILSNGNKLNTEEINNILDIVKYSLPMEF